jgi:hypothetical protein
MFKKLNNIDTAFRHVRAFTMIVIMACALISVFALYQSFKTVNRMQDKIYVLANGKAIEAYASDRRDNIPVEARDHVRKLPSLLFYAGPG